MVNTNSLDEINIISTLLDDIHMSFGEVFDQRVCRLTKRKLIQRYNREGLGFLTKTLPRLGKMFDRTLAGQCAFNCADIRFKPYGDTQLPKLFGELFERVLSKDGEVVSNACVRSIRYIRDLCYLFYKLKVPYATEDEHNVVNSFVKTEDEIKLYDDKFNHIADKLDRNIEQFGDPDAYELDRNVEFIHAYHGETNIGRDTCVSTGIDLSRVDWSVPPDNQTPTVLQNIERCFEDSGSVIRRARRLLCRLFSTFDPTDIHPRHGPGVVSTRETLSGKFRWTNISSLITDMYPMDEYFYPSMGAVCDLYKTFNNVSSKTLPARVLLVPKDSRGPRLISCEPVDFQWIQQGLSRAIVRHIERHPLTRFNVRFTDQQPNQFGALLGSLAGKYSTLDLKEASDRVTVGLVRLLFPSKILSHLVACRSLQTKLPSGKIITLRKFAPMGSALCFPVMALTIWSILTAAAQDADTRESILVYGDDIVVPTGFAGEAIRQLESVGLLCNRDKSCFQGLFRESCGVDAFKGLDVTPLRLRNRWKSHRCPNTYLSWLAYANQFADKGYHNVYRLIYTSLEKIYGWLPIDEDGITSVPSLRYAASRRLPCTYRFNPTLQRVEVKCWITRPVRIRQSYPGWMKLLRYFSEHHSKEDTVDTDKSTDNRLIPKPMSGSDVGTFPVRREVKLTRGWSGSTLAYIPREWSKAMD